MNQNQEPMGPLMKAAQKYVVTVVCILDAMLLIGGIRYLPYSYGDWLAWVEIIVLVLMLILLLRILPDLYRKK